MTDPKSGTYSFFYFQWWWSSPSFQIQHQITPEIIDTGSCLLKPTRSINFPIFKAYLVFSSSQATVQGQRDGVTNPPPHRRRCKANTMELKTPLHIASPTHPLTQWFPSNPPTIKGSVVPPSQVVLTSPRSWRQHFLLSDTARGDGEVGKGRGGASDTADLTETGPMYASAPRQAAHQDMVVAYRHRVEEAYCGPRSSGAGEQTKGGRGSKWTPHEPTIL